MMTERYGTPSDMTQEQADRLMRSNVERSKLVQKLFEAGRVNATDPLRFALMKAIANADGYSCDEPDDGHYAKLADSVIETLKERGIDLSDG
jgi:hypothetical protein